MLRPSAGFPQPGILQMATIAEPALARLAGHCTKNSAFRLEFNRKLGRLQWLQARRAGMQRLGIIKRLLESAEACLAEVGQIERETIVARLQAQHIR